MKQFMDIPVPVCFRIDFNDNTSTLFTVEIVKSEGNAFLLELRNYISS
jgi:hypothetical protein